MTIARDLEVRAVAAAPYGFSESEEHRSFAQTARRFARDVLGPRRGELAAAGRIPMDIRLAMGELGLIGAELPDSLGGLGVGHVTSAVVTEAIAEGDLSASYVQLLASLNGMIITRYARPELAQAILPRLCRGEIAVALALTEPQGGSDAAALRLRAERKGDRYILTGEKTSISMADQADYAVVFARTGAETDRGRGVTAFLVDLSLPGVVRTRFRDLGQHGIGRGSLFFDGVEVPLDHRLGEEGTGFVQVMQGFDFSRALIGLQCLSLARISLAETWRHVSERQAFGKPLAANQGVTFPLAEAETHVEAARLLCYRTLALKDAGEPHTREAAMCKWLGPKLAFEVIQQCLLLHGHSGWSTELPFEQRLRDVLGFQIGDGAAQIMKMIIARDHLARI
ncbi:acyl-CoA dehydrogenase family protein [Phenylobacterium sp.]|uniref:acyl-CoA dehydrogenase family protein n=1 Tax=Phenylobacterium sp. TaxID=1871053 RepID=UPI002EDAECC0